MRPSDVPTYVEAGAADVGITGKDVLREQAERDVVRAARPRLRRLPDGVRHQGRRPTRRPRRCAAWGSCASRRSTRASPRATSSDTGRQAEIVEVKGSVELAPLTGLVEAIVDLTATGTTLRENGLVVREEIVDLDRPPDRQPRRVQAQAAEIDAVLSGCAAALSARTRDAAALRGARARARPGGRVRRRRGARRSSRACAARGDAAVAEYESTTSAASTAALRVAADELDAAAAALRSDVRAGAGGGDGEHRRGGRRQPRRRRDDRAAPGPDACACARCPCAAPAIYVPGGRAPYPSSVVMGVATARAAGRRGGRASPRPAHPVMLAAARCAASTRSTAMGGAQAIAALALRDGDASARVDVIVGPGNLYVQEAKRQVAHVVGIDGFAGPSDLVRHRAARPTRSWSALDLLAQAEHGAGSLVVAVSDDPALLARVLAATTAVARSQRPTRWTTRSRSPRRSRPSTCSSWARRPRRSRRASAPPAALFVGAPAAPRSATTSRAPTTCCPPAAPRASPPGLNVRHFRRRMSEVRIRRGGRRALAARRRARSPRAEGFDGARRVDGGGTARIPRHDAHRRHRPARPGRPTSR